jgi:hypothetical protein
MSSPGPKLTICTLCRDSIRFDRSFSCNRADCPVTPPKPLIRRWWFILSVVAVVALVASVGVHLWIKARDLTRVPSILSSKSQEATWRGQPWQIHVDAKGYGTVTFQWYAGFMGDTSEPVPGATSGTFKIPNLQEKNRYWLRVTNDYGTADSEAILVTPQNVDTRDLDRELDELLFFTRSILEQTDNIAVYERQLQSIDEMDPEQRKIFQNLIKISLGKRIEAFGKLDGKLVYLRKDADPDAIDRLFEARRPPATPTEKIDDERVRKTFSLAEATWRAARDGSPLSTENIVDHASSVLPF